jgi:hypothetical protein
MALDMKGFDDNDQMMGRKKKKMTDKPMEINKILLDVWYKLVDSCVLVEYHELEDTGLVLMDGK